MQSVRIPLGLWRATKLYRSIAPIEPPQAPAEASFLLFIRPGAAALMRSTALSRSVYITSCVVICTCSTPLSTAGHSQRSGRLRASQSVSQPRETLGVLLAHIARIGSRNAAASCETGA